MKDLNNIGIDTPEYESYTDDDQIHTPDIDSVTPEAFDTYIGAEVDCQDTNLWNVT